MAFMRHHYPKFNFVYTECSGKLDDPSLMIHLMSFSRELSDLASVRHLIDMRYLRDSTQLTTNGMVRMAKMYPDMFNRTQIASAVLIAPSEDKKTVEIFSQLFTGPHLKVGVFKGGFDEPLHWLGYDQTDIKKIKRFIANHTRPSTAPNHARSANPSIQGD